MRILIIGSAGQVGRALTARLCQEEHLAVIGLDLVEPIDLAGPIVPFMGLDVLDGNALGAALHQVRPNLVINAAAYTDVEGAEDEPKLAQQLNANFPGLLADTCADLDVPLVHFSTDYVYSGDGDLPQAEDAPIKPQSVYAATKFDGEEQIRRLCTRHLILRTSWVYHPGHKSFPATMLKLFQSRSTISVVDDQWGAPTSANAIASGVADIARTLMQPGFEGWGTYNFCCQGVTTWHQFARELKRRGSENIGGRFHPDLQILPVTTDKYPTKAARPLNSRLDLTKLKSRLNITLPHWQAALDLEIEGLCRFAVEGDVDKKVSQVQEDIVF